MKMPTSQLIATIPGGEQSAPIAVKVHSIGTITLEQSRGKIIIEPCRVGELCAAVGKALYVASHQEVTA